MTGFKYDSSCQEYIFPVDLFFKDKGMGENHQKDRKWVVYCSFYNVRTIDFYQQVLKMVVENEWGRSTDSLSLQMQQGLDCQEKA